MKLVKAWPLQIAPTNKVAGIIKGFGMVIYRLVSAIAFSISVSSIAWSFSSIPPVAVDHDFDGVVTFNDNCPTTYNYDQRDADKDGFGDGCDRNPVSPAAPNANDYDLDGIAYPQDNCPVDSNPDQADYDGNGVGDICDGSYSWQVRYRFYRDYDSGLLWTRFDIDESMSALQIQFDTDVYVDECEIHFSGGSEDGYHLRRHYRRWETIVMDWKENKRVSRLECRVSNQEYSTSYIYLYAYGKKGTPSRPSYSNVKCPIDCNSDSVFDANDANALASYLFNPGIFNPECTSPDLNKDGSVDEIERHNLRLMSMRPEWRRCGR